MEGAPVQGTEETDRVNKIQFKVSYVDYGEKFAWFSAETSAEDGDESLRPSRRKNYSSKQVTCCRCL